MMWVAGDSRDGSGDSYEAQMRDVRDRVGQNMAVASIGSLHGWVKRTMNSQIAPGLATK